MRFESFSFGSIRIDGVTYEHDLVIDRGEIRKRRPPNSIETPSDIRPSHRKKASHGAAAGWWWGPAPREGCP